METLILGWYILVETRSVLLLTVFASLQHLGTLISPMFGVMADRLGHRAVLCAMRGFYTLLATLLMTLTLLDMLTPAHVFVIAGLMGLVRPSDVGMRAAVVGGTMPPVLLVGAMAIQRTTQDSARIAGALTGASLVALLGMGPAYLAVALIYATSVALTVQAGRVGTPRAIAPLPPDRTIAAASPWGDLKEGLAYVRRTPHLLAVMVLAFLLNITAFPLFTGLLPYVAKEVYGTDQTGLGYLVAGAAFGSLLGSLLMSRYGGSFPHARLMVAGGIAWFVFLLVFAHVTQPLLGIAVLFLAGLAQSISQVPMAALLLRTSDERYRGRVMGIRMLAIYGNVPGLLLAGQLIPRIGFPLTATLYCVFGIAVTAAIAMRWRADLWHREAAANAA